MVNCNYFIFGNGEMDSYYSYYTLHISLTSSEHFRSNSFMSKKTNAIILI